MPTPVTGAMTRLLVTVLSNGWNRMWYLPVIPAISRRKNRAMSTAGIVAEFAGIRPGQLHHAVEKS
jgi:hypothetical protein